MQIEGIESKDEFIEKVTIVGSNISFNEEGGSQTIISVKDIPRTKLISNRKLTEEVIQYEIDEKDSEFVKMIKMAVNEKQIMTMTDIHLSGMCDSEAKCYNLYRSLSIHHSLTEDRMKLWLGILNKKLIMELQDEQ